MSEIDVSKCELVDCWFYLDHTPPKGQGDWCGVIHKGACKLNSTDCKDTPIERCLIKSLYKQLQQSKAENEELNRKLKISYTAEAFVNAQKEHTQLDKKINKYKQCLDEIEKYLNQYEMLGKLNIKYLLQLIKQAKEGK